VIREIYYDLRSGKQMNRLVQGDVGSGKTIVSFICMLVVIGNGAQVAYDGSDRDSGRSALSGIIQPFAQSLGIEIDISERFFSQVSEKKSIHQKLEDGSLQILVGTHALIEDKVQFKNLDSP
jgi:ATP-dependent DNA helicase RecG